MDVKNLWVVLHYFDHVVANLKAARGLRVLVLTVIRVAIYLFKLTLL